MSAATPIANPDRSKALRELGDEQFDVLVIGGGITGAGVAREAAARGLSVALVEASDFAAGTSSRSSKLIHGGLRYLERGELKLVQKTALERKEINRLAPHLAEPRWMVMPVKTRSMLFILKAGVTTYERLGAVPVADRHQVWKGKRFLEHEPHVDTKTFPFALSYREFLTDDARLVLANLAAAANYGAKILNYAKVEGFLREGDRASGASVTCALTGERIEVRARAVVNAAGPWVESLQRMENPSAPPLLHLSKGVHIALPASKLPVQNMVVLRPPDRRRIFAIRRGDTVYVGTTDTTYTPGAELWPTIDQADVDYLLEPIARYFNVAAPSSRDVVGAWAGLRPLLADPNTKNPQELSRRDELLVGPLGVISVAGGKLTGFRDMADNVLGAVNTRLGIQTTRADGDVPLPGGDFSGGVEGLASQLAGSFALDETTACRMARLYGAQAHEILAMGSQLLAPELPVVTGEARWAVEREAASTLEDVFYRRLRAPLYLERSVDLLEPLAKALAEPLAWTTARIEQELAATRARQAEDLSFTANPATSVVAEGAPAHAHGS